MASWWMPWKQLEVLRAINDGRAVMTDGKVYWWLGGLVVTQQAKALVRRGLIAPGTHPRRIYDTMHVTGTGLNALRSHSGLTKKHYKL